MLFQYKNKAEKEKFTQLLKELFLGGFGLSLEEIAKQLEKQANKMAIKVMKSSNALSEYLSLDMQYHPINYIGLLKRKAFNPHECNVYSPHKAHSQVVFRGADFCSDVSKALRLYLKIVHGKYYDYDNNYYYDYDRKNIHYYRHYYITDGYTPSSVIEFYKHHCIDIIVDPISIDNERFSILYALLKNCIGNEKVSYLECERIYETFGFTARPICENNTEQKRLSKLFKSMRSDPLCLMSYRDIFEKTKNNIIPSYLQNRHCKFPIIPLSNYIKDNNSEEMTTEINNLWKKIPLEQMPIFNTVPTYRPLSMFETLYEFRFFSCPIFD